MVGIKVVVVRAEDMVVGLVVVGEWEAVPGAVQMRLRREPPF